VARRLMRGLAILKPDHLGDLVLSAPAIRAIRARRGDVTLFVSSACERLARFLFPDIVDIRTADLRHLLRTGAEGISPETLARQLDDFELVLCLRHDAILQAMVSRLKAPHEIVSGDHRVHETVIQRSIVARIVGWYSRTDLFSGKDHPWPARLAHVALCVAAGFPANRWANALWFELARDLARRGIRLTLVGGPAETHDIRLLSGLLSAVSHDVLIGTNDFRGFLQALDPIDLVIATDGGTAHLCSLRKPVCSLFGSSPWRRYAPFGRNNVVITRDELCSPCVQFSTTELNGCLTRECMAGIAPREVVHVACSNGVHFPAFRALRVERGVSHRDRP
jgi:ADP-heptose:LPS heptosyltransferase